MSRFLFRDFQDKIIDCIADKKGPSRAVRGGRHVRGEGSQLEAAMDASHELTKLHNGDSHA